MRTALSTLLLGALAVAAGAQGAPLTLDQAMGLARKSSEALRLSQLALEKSQAALGETRGKALPHVDFQASGSYLLNPPPGYTVNPGDLGVYPGLGKIPLTPFSVGASLHDYFTLTATINQPLFTWGKIRNAIDLASLQVDSAGTDMSARQREIDWQVRRSYFSAVLAHRSQDALHRMRDTAARIASDRQKAFDQGTINKESLLEVKSTLASMDAKLTEAAQSETSALAGLSVLTGQDTDGASLVTDFPDALPALDEQALLALALQGSTDMVAARTRIDQARKKLSVEQGGALLHPDVNLGISLDVSGQEDLPYSGAWSFSNNTWNVDVLVTLGVKMSAFDGLESRNRILQAEKDMDMAGVALSQQAKTVRIQLRQAVEAAVKADAEARSSRSRLEYLQEKLRNAGVALANGQISRDDQETASIQADAAVLDLLLAQFEREEALADIQRITGVRP
ncbi:MAG TPA: TolC family protein [Spirochaetia bacterium]|nr:TolC family protein [Spirochaetia bacterium]